LISLDPIGFTQRPSPKGVSCRSDLSAAAAALARTANTVLTKCHLQQIDDATSLPGVDCNQIGQADVANVVPAAEETLRDAAVSDCEGPDLLTEGPRISPAVYGLRTCPAPCDSIVIGACSAGLIGNSCEADRECDTSPGAADGKCGEWDSATYCMACLQESAATSAVSSLVGNVPRSVISPEHLKCTFAVVKAYSSMVGIFSKEMLGCQKKADAAKAALAPGKTCQTADLKGLRAAVEAKARALMDKVCSYPDIADAQLCGGAATPTALGDCIVEAAKDTIQALTAAVYPENAQPPGACPASVDLTMVAGTAGSCMNDSQCITGQCIGGKCVTNTSLDVGWTGHFHGNDFADKFEMDLGLSCAAAEAPCGTCTITGIEPTSGNCRCANDVTARCDEPFSADLDDCGGNQCRCFFEPPRPLAGGGVPLCLLSEHAAEVSGTMDVDTGQMDAAVDLKWNLHFGLTQTSPCPRCVGDGTANDGIAGGTCNGGPRNGLVCDTQATDPTFGPVSLDCPPNGAASISGAGHTLDIDLSTGPSVLSYAVACDPPLGASMCACGQCSGDPTIACESTTDCTAAGAGTCTTNTGAPRAPNGCGDLSCEPAPGDPDDGECTGDEVTYCDGFTRPSGDGVIPCATNADCDALDPDCPGGDCGSCALSQTKRCFLDPVPTHGTVHATSPTYGAGFCMGPTSSAGANALIGLPGPGRLRLHAVPTYICSTAPNEVYTPGVGGCPP
jgi:hypothetical protein